MDPSAVVACAYQAVRDRDMEELLEVFDEDCVFIDVALQEEAQGHAAFRAYMDENWRSFPDFSPENPSFLVSGNEVAAQLDLRATHAGEFLGIPATGRVVTWKAAAFYTIDPRSSKIVREVYYYDSATLIAALQAGS